MGSIDGLVIVVSVLRGLLVFKTKRDNLINPAFKETKDKTSLNGFLDAEYRMVPWHFFA